MKRKTYGSYGEIVRCFLMQYTLNKTINYHHHHLHYMCIHMSIYVVCTCTTVMYVSVAADSLIIHHYVKLL